jgi:predicted glycoside hydrolase/deacetylase ChbG (UPF0249 family)
MLIINADDWGRCPAETDAALECYKKGRITSVSAMLFMEDSERAAAIARDHKLDAGLHLNFTDSFTNSVPATLKTSHRRTARFLGRSKYAQLIYNPLLRANFADSYRAQVDEFQRLYGKPPSRIDGHHHMHLCANVLFSNLIPTGTKVRRNFSFWPGEKSGSNRTYRALIDRWLGRKYRLTDYFFDLTQCMEENKWSRVAALAQSTGVELMTHPVNPGEQAYLMSDEFEVMLQRLNVGGYALV